MPNARGKLVIFFLGLFTTANITWAGDTRLMDHSLNGSIFVEKLIIKDDASLEDLAACISVHKKMIPERFKIIFDHGYYVKEPYEDITNLIIPGYVQEKAFKPIKYLYYCNMHNYKGNFVVDRVRTWGGMRLDKVTMRNRSKGLFGNPLLENK